MHRCGLPFTATRLPDGRVAVGTIQGGLHQLDGQGRLLGHLTKAKGLKDDAVPASFVDREGGLWLTTGNGLARAEVGNPLSRFDEPNGLSGAVSALERHRDDLYAGTAQGLFWLRPGPAARFERVASIDSQTWGFFGAGRRTAGRQ